MTLEEFALHDLEYGAGVTVLTKQSIRLKGVFAGTKIVPTLGEAAIQLDIGHHTPILLPFLIKDIARIEIPFNQGACDVRDDKACFGGLATESDRL